MSAASNTLRLILIGEDKSASKTVKGVGDETDKSSKKMQTFHKVGAAAGIALAGGLALAGKAAFDMTKKAADDAQAASKLANTIHKTTGATKSQQAAVEDWITAQGKATGVTDDELRPALSKLVVATHSVSKAQHLAMLAQDVSIGTGKSLESVSFALAKAQNGNVTGLSRLGVATKNADGSTKSLNAITKDLANTYGGAAAKNADTAAGKQKILTTQYAELQEQIGAQLLPVMSKLLGVGLRIVGWISDNTRVAGIIVGVLGALVGVTWAVSAATKAWAAVTKIAAGVQWALNAAMDANPIGLVVIAIAALVFALIVAYKKSETFRNIVNASFHAVQKVVGAVVGFIKAHWKLLFVALTGPIGLAMLVIAKHWSKIMAGVGNVIGFIRSHWKLLLAILAGPFGVAVLLIVRNFDKIRSAASSVADFVRGQFGNVVDFMRGIPGKIAAMAGAYLSAGKSLGSHIISGIFSGLKAIGGFAGDLAGSIKGAVNSALHLPFTIHGPGPLPDFTIPAFAKGGIVTKPTIGLIGEAGPEAVIPLGRGGGLGSGSGGDLGTITLDVTQDGKTIQRKLLTLKRTNGGLALGLT